VSLQNAIQDQRARLEAELESEFYQDARAAGFTHKEAKALAAVEARKQAAEAYADAYRP